MLTPKEISDKVFVKAVFGGYDMTGVDEFLEIVATDYEALYKENAILKGKLKVLVEKVEEYRSTEDAMRMALLTAQRMGDEIKHEANKEKSEVIKSAEMEAQAKLAEVAQRVAEEELRLSVAAKETSKFIELSQALMRRHSDFLTKLETARRAVRPDDSFVQIPGPPPPPPPPPTREELIADAAAQIGSVMEQITRHEAPAPPEPMPEPEPEPEPDPAYEGYEGYEDEGEPTKTFTIGSDEDDDSVTPRPKFDFNDLKFGNNVETGKKKK
jgi:cell division initiation protein